MTGTELRTAWEVGQIQLASEFTVVRHEGVEGRTILSATSLEEALREASDLGPDAFGRTPMVYAITVGDRQSIHVDWRHLELLGVNV